MLVTDAMPSVGSDETVFLIHGREIHREGDRLLGADNTLAGSTLTMAGAVKGMMEQGRVGLDVAAHMASATPAAFLGLGAQLGRIAPGYRADLLLVDENVAVQQCWIAGVRRDREATTGQCVA
jgi:N-acetylglucosamine-6-phosphate deacetylase